MKKNTDWLKSFFSPRIMPISPSHNPPYIDYSNDYIVPVPGMAEDSWLYCFPIKGTYQNILNTINQRLNFSPLKDKVQFFPLSETIMLVMSDIKKGYTLDPNYTKYGYLEEKAIQIFVPLVECKLNRQLQWEAQRLVFYIPYIFVDQPFNMSIGREEFGFPKSFAQFDMPASPTTAQNFQVNAYGFKNFDKENPEFGRFHPFVNIKQTDAQVAEGKWDTHQDAWQHIQQYFVLDSDKPPIDYGLPFVWNEVIALYNKTLPLIFLKQFRDIADPEKACYQAIAIGNGITEKFFSGWFLGSAYDITISDMASFPICEDLGLPNQMTVAHPFWVNVNLKFDTGEVLWQSK